MPIYGKDIYLKMGVGASADVDLTDNHGLASPQLAVDGAPISRPTQGDIMQYSEAAQQGLSITFNIESDDTTDPLFWLAAGKERAYEYGPETGSGKTKITGKGILGATPISSPNDNLVTYSVTLNINSMTVGAQ